MTEVLVKPGDKLHVITRRLFEEDLRRHFVGEVDAIDGDLCRLQGYTFVFNTTMNQFQRRPERRTRIFALSEAGHIVNVLPPEVDIATLEYKLLNRRLVVVDPSGFSLDIHEFGSTS